MADGGQDEPSAFSAEIEGLLRSVSGKSLAAPEHTQAQRAQVLGALYSSDRLVTFRQRWKLSKGCSTQQAVPRFAVLNPRFPQSTLRGFSCGVMSRDVV